MRQTIREEYDGLPEIYDRRLWEDKVERKIRLGNVPMWVVVAVLRGDRFGAPLPVLVSACAILAIFSVIRTTQRIHHIGTFPT